MEPLYLPFLSTLSPAALMIQNQLIIQINTLHHVSPLHHDGIPDLFPEVSLLMGRYFKKKSFVIHSSLSEQKGHGPPKYELRSCNVILPSRRAILGSTACFLREDSVF